MRHGMHLAHGRTEYEVDVEEVVLDHREHQRRRAHLEIGRDLGEIRIAHDHVQPAESLGVGVRLVPRVDDRSLERGLESDLHLEEVRALRQLESRAPAVLTEADSPRPREDLTSDEEGNQVSHDLRERRRAPHEVVLVRPIRGALVVGVVLVEIHRHRPRHLGHELHRPRHDALPRLVPQHRIARVGDLGARVLRMRMVDVETSTVGEDEVGQTRVVVSEL